MAQTLLDLPKTAQKGAIITIKTLIAHPMETGYRREISGAVIPRDIIRSLTCLYNGERVFKADFYPAMAANPFVSFTLVARKSGPLQFIWQGDKGFEHRESAMLEVVG